MPREIWFRSNSRSHRFLSNFYLTPIPLGDFRTARSAEHAYQCCKAFPAEREWVLAAPTALEAMRRGRQVPQNPAFDRIVSMHRVLRMKFEPGTALARMLLDTGDSVLIENNRGPWGGRDGGENRLGLMLMQLRSELRAQEGNRS